MHLITEVNPIHQFLNIQKELKRVTTAYYLTELVDRLSATNQDNPPVFNLLLNNLQKLNSKISGWIIIFLLKTYKISRLSQY